jgi:hypothetical protein
MESMASIASSQIEPSVALSEYRSRSSESGTRAPQHTLRDSPLPPAVQPVPAPVPEPVAPPSEAFTAALIAEHMPSAPVTPMQLNLMLGGSWQVPESSLQLTDLHV